MEPQVIMIGDSDIAMALMARAARLCYGHDKDDLDYKEKVILLTKVLGMRHFSILEHATFSFLITGVSRNFTHQFVRHRHISFAQQSFHYTIAKDKTLPMFKTALSPQAFDRVAGIFDKAFETYEDLLKMGVPRDEARHILPTGMPTKIMATSNLREWMQFVQVRTCTVNCAEIRNVAQQIGAKLHTHMPFLRPYMGPSCLFDKCHEGKRSCGKKWIA